MDKQITIRAVVVDDELNGRKNIVDSLARYCPDVDIIGEANSAISGVELVAKKRPDLVFLDIEMPGGNGFELLKLLSQRDFEVVFVTAYDKYGIQAIKFCAIDYLLKPLNYLDLIAAVNKVADRVSKKQDNIRLMQFVQNMERQTKEKRIALPTMHNVEFVVVDTIIRCQSDNNYTEFYLSDGRKVMVCKTLKEYEDILTDLGFFRPHQSHLINLNYLSAFIKNDGGALKMKDGTLVPVSRFKKNEVKSLFSKTFL